VVLGGPAGGPPGPMGPKGDPGANCSYTDGVTPWTAITLGSSFTRYSTGYDIPSWRMNGARLETKGLLRIEVVIASGVAEIGPTGVPFPFTQIVGTVGLAGSSGDQVGQVRMATNGVLSLYKSAGGVSWPVGGWITLDNLSFHL